MGSPHLMQARHLKFWFVHPSRLQPTVEQALHLPSMPEHELSAACSFVR